MQPENFLRFGFDPRWNFVISQRPSNPFQKQSVSLPLESRYGTYKLD
jgi:hypothetical protein